MTLAKQRCDVCKNNYTQTEGMFKIRGINKYRWSKLKENERPKTYGDQAVCINCQKRK